MDDDGCQMWWNLNIDERDEKKKKLWALSYFLPVWAYDSFLPLYVTSGTKNATYEGTY